eukprot:8546632-Karenia_brevis.AAC.1
MEEKLHLVLCCHYRRIPFRFCRSGYIPPGGEPNMIVTEETINAEIERAEAAARSSPEEAFPQSFPPPGPRAPQNPGFVDNSLMLPRSSTLTERVNQRAAAEDAERVAGGPIASANASAARRIMTSG